MTLSEPGVERRKSSVRPLTRFAWLTLAYNIAVILWGAYVRATGSGAGCGNHWPLCNGSVLPRMPQAQTIIEFTHRLTSGLAVLMVSSLLVWCWQKTSKGDWARSSSAVALLLLFSEAMPRSLACAVRTRRSRSVCRAGFFSLRAFRQHAASPGCLGVDRALALRRPPWLFCCQESS